MGYENTVTIALRHLLILGSVFRAPFLGGVGEGGLFKLLEAVLSLQSAKNNFLLWIRNVIKTLFSSGDK